MHELSRRIAAAALVLGFGAGCYDAIAQSLMPMEKRGATPSDEKGFRLNVGNPYATRLTFVAVPMDPDFTAPVGDAEVRPAEFRLAPGAARSVLLRFRIDPEKKERTIGVCVSPKDLGGSILPRVCGRYTGFIRRAGG